MEASETGFQITASLSQEPTADSASEDEAPQEMLCKLEDPSSATSYVIDSDSSHYIDGPVSSAFAEPIDSSYALESFDKDHSQDDKDSLNPTLLPSPPYVLPKIEIFDDYPHDLPANCGHFTSPDEDQGSWFWSY